jgi:S-adenosylmethionine-diacylgycerolhomoserine-N-methlytransferase
MGLFADLRAVWPLLTSAATGATHAERMEAFYHAQAGVYDAFRPRLLHGRPELMAALDLPEGGSLLDLGCGTGGHLEYLGERLRRCRRVTLVDLSSSMLRIAWQRMHAHGWNNVTLVQADATTFTPEDAPVDVVLFSYSLTMIPDWFLAIDQARQLLKPGGVIGVTDFSVSRKFPAAGLRRHSAWQRSFWPWYFARANVFLSPDQLPYLQSRFETVLLREQLGTVPFSWGLKAPYFVFVGRKS